jgi:hypothetical protein
MRFFIAIGLILTAGFQVNAQKFQVSFSAGVYNEPFTGNVLLYLSKKNEQPKDHTAWPCYRMQVRNVKPGERIVFSDSSLSYPTLLSRIDRGDYYVQVVWDRNLEGRVIGLSTGNPYSVSRKVNLARPDETFTVVCDQVVPAQIFKETRFVKEIKAPSTLLSQFHKKNVTLDAAVILPVEYYSQPSRKFPVYFIVAGYGSDYHHYSAEVSTDTLPSIPLDTISCIKVYLDGNCSLGHSTYSNSDNNGPVGEAFTKEFIPLLDKKYRTNGGRVIRGHSSGGWTVVYLLTHYPELFAGGNASAPDPVDFHRFVRTNLYADIKRIKFVDALTIGHKPDLNVVYDRTNIARSIEDIVYRGEQNVSFNAAFGPMGSNRLPKPLFHPVTEELDRSVFEYWKRFDLTQYVLKNWPKLKNDLGNKLRISVGNEDNAFLNFSVMLMEEEMKKIGSPIKFAYYPGTHFTVATPEYKKAENAWLKEKYLEWLGQGK